MRINVGLLLIFVFAASFARSAESLPLEGLVGTDGIFHLSAEGKNLCTASPGVFEKGWRQDGATPTKEPGAFVITTSTGVAIHGTCGFQSAENGATFAYTFTPSGDVELNTVHVSADFPVAVLAGGHWKADEKEGEFPVDTKDVALFNGPIKKLEATLPSGVTLTWTFDQATPVLLQDNRKWGPTFSIRIGVQADGKVFKKDDAVKFGFTLSAKPGMKISQDAPVTITAGPDWIPLQLEQEIEAGSALDFSTLGLQDAPAGKHGRVLASPEGQFAFEDSPKIPRRFYGVNLCFSAQYLPHDQAERLADRFARLGYNAVRIHHYEMELTEGQTPTTKLNADKLDQLDYLLAAFKKRGIYVTTDLFVSRQVAWKDIGLDQPGNVPADTFKILIPVLPAAYENWKAFSVALLGHTNPYTKLRYADDPALAWLSLINEGMFANFLGEVHKFPEWTVAWNAWLAKKYPTRAALASAWGAALKETEDPAQKNVALPGSIYDSGPRESACLVFFGELDREMTGRMKKFLRGELHCNALVTNSNAWSNFVSSQIGRQDYDYVDDHFYVDHPQFLEKLWQLPTRSENVSTVSEGANGGRGCAFTRYPGKPFTITEFNYAGPGRYRSVGGMITGALAALQGWNGVWRFAYSHNRANLFAPMAMGNFDNASDPLNQASDRAALCLFLRGDMKAAEPGLEIEIDPARIEKLSPMPHLSPAWNWAAWIERVSSRVSKNSTTDQAISVNRYAKSPLIVKGGQDVASVDIDTRENASDPARNMFKSSTRSIDRFADTPGTFQDLIIDGFADMFTLDTPKTAGGYAPAGKKIESADHRLAISVQTVEATVWLSSLDDKPLTESSRILVTHLTDLQNTDIHYAEKARKTLLNWGKLPHLVRAGKATIELKRGDAAALKVWALSTGGKRLFEVKAASTGGVLTFTADCEERSAEFGAHFCYEIAGK